jgi:Zn-dependent protease
MQSFKLGSIFGFEIRIDLSWFIIFFLILWTLTTNQFPVSYPGLSGGAYLVMGIAGTILFFVSLLLHELSHSIVAQMKGIPVEGITLFAFGGISRTRMEAETPGDEFQIAGVGPLTSLILAGLAGLVWYVGRAAGWSVLIVGVAGYLAWINVALAIFNLLPGFPLDGGRLFRSIVWKLTNNLRTATKVASIGGRVLGYSLIFLGFWQLFSPIPSLIGGLLFILIGWFLNNAAVASYQDLLVRTMLEGVRVREVMTLNPETVPANLNLQDVSVYFHERKQLHRW